MKVLFALIVVLVLVLVPGPAKGQSIETSDSGACTVTLFEEGAISVNWTDFPKDGKMYLATYRMDDLTTGNVLFTSTDQWIMLGSNMNMFSIFIPELNPRHTYKVSGVVCVAYFDDYHLTKSDIRSYFMNLESYLPVLLKRILR